MKFLTREDVWKLFEIKNYDQWRKIKDQFVYVVVQGKRRFYPEDDVLRLFQRHQRTTGYKWWERLPIANAGDYEPDV